MCEYVFCERSKTEIDQNFCHAKVLNTKFNEELLICRRCNYGIQLANSVLPPSKRLKKKARDILTIKKFCFIVQKIIKNDRGFIKKIVIENKKEDNTEILFVTDISNLVWYAKEHYLFEFQENQFISFIKKYKLHYIIQEKIFYLIFDNELSIFLRKSLNKK